MTYTALETSQRSGAPVDLFRFRIGTGTAFWLTSSDVSLVYNSDTYTPEAISRTEIKQDAEADQGAVVIGVPRTHPIASYFLLYSPEPPMQVEIFSKHRTDAEVSRIFSGTVGSVAFAGAVAKLTCLPEFEALRRLIPRNTCQGQCNWALYSGQCGVTRTAFQVLGPVSLISLDTIQSSPFSAKPDGWFNNGYVERADGSRRWIVTHVGSTLTLMSPFIGLAVGETVTAFAGCDRTVADCNGKFSNIARFLGFPYVPKRNPFGSSGVS